MQHRRTLRARLTLQLAVVVLVSVALFSEVAKDVLGLLQRDWVNAHLRTSAAAFAFVATRTPPAALPGALQAVTEPDFDGAILDRSGHVVAATATVPDVVAGNAGGAAAVPAVLKVGRDDLQFRIGLVALGGSAHGRTAVFWHRVDQAASDADEKVATVFDLTVPLIGVLALLIGDRLTRRALAPLTAVTAMATTIEAHDLSGRIDTIPADAELAELCATFNRMLERLEAAFERQRRFTADVSHEFRAPLSVITAEADLAAAGLDTEEEYRQSASVVLREAKLIEAITEDLLLLARADAGAGHHVEPVDVSRTAACAADTLHTAADARRIVVTRDLDVGAWIAGSPTAITRIVIALLHNAIKFSDDGANVSVAVRHTAERVQLVVADQGPGFSADALAHAFERFWRGDSVRGRSGTGLGLAIVRSLVDQANGTIAIANASPNGCRVSVTFPASSGP